MGQVKVHVQSFNSGELSETMASRFGVEKVASGCRLLRNMLPHVHGPAEKRPGMERLGYASSTTVGPRLLEFNFSATTRFAIEFAPGVFRFWSNGALVTTLTTVSHPYTPSESFEVHAKQVNDVVYLVHRNHPPHKLTRLADNNWAMTEIGFKYPALLDEYYEASAAAAPTVTAIHTPELEEASEYVMQRAAPKEIPWWRSSPAGVNDSACFELNWTWPSALADAAASAATLTLQILTPAGVWTDAGSITLSTTSTAPQKTQYSISAGIPDTLLNIRRRVWGGSSWGVWANFSTVPSFNPAGTTVATLPSVQFRLVYGPESQEGSPTHKVVVSGITAIEGPLTRAPYSGSMDLVTVIQSDVTLAYSRNWAMPATVPASLVSSLQIWTGTAWTTLKDHTLLGGSAMNPAAFRGIRLRQSGSNVVYEECTEISASPIRNTWAVVATVAMTQAEWRIRLRSTVGVLADAGLGIAATVPITYPPGVIGPPVILYAKSWNIERTASATSAPNTGGVLVPAGQWQFRSVIASSAVIPAGATITLRKQVNGVWLTLQTWSLADGGGVLEYDGTQPETLFAAATLVSVLYSSTNTVKTESNTAIETVVFPLSQAIKLAVDGVVGSARTMTSTASLFQAAHVGSYWQISHRLDSAYTEIAGVVGTFPSSRRLSNPIRLFGKWDFYSYGTWKGKVFLERKTGSQTWEVLRVWSSNNDRNIIANGEAETDSEYRIRVESGMVGTAATGAAVPRFLLEAADARNYGLVKITGYTSATQVTVEVISTLASREPTTLWAEGAWSEVRGYPAAIATHEGRMWFGGSSHQPATIWGSVSNDFENFRRSTLDDGSIVVTLAAETANYIRWMAPAADSLFIGTGGEEWSLFSNTEGAPLTPANLRARPRGAYSSSTIQAKRLQDAMMFVQRDGRRIRRADFNQSTGEFLASDVTVLAPHVSESGFKQLAVSQSPQAIIWGVTNDGRLVSLTFEREQNVFAWVLHETDGLVRSVAVLTGETTDEVWLSTERNGRAHIERLDPLAMADGVTDWEEFLYSDCSVRFGAGATVNVPHLTSRNVVGLVDGVPFTATVNGSGVLTLPTTAVTGGSVGLPFTAQLQPMRLEVPLQDGSSQTRQFKVARVGVRVINSRSGQVADAPDGVWETLPYTHGAGLFTGMVETAITGRTQDNANVVVKDSTPLPFMVGGIVLDLDVYGD